MSFITKKTATRGTGSAPIPTPAVNVIAIPRTLNSYQFTGTAIDKGIRNSGALVRTTVNWRMALNWRFRTNRRPAFTGTQSKAPAKKCPKRNAGSECTEISKQNLQPIKGLSFNIHVSDYNYIQEGS